MKRPVLALAALSWVAVILSCGGPDPSESTRRAWATDKDVAKKNREKLVEKVNEANRAAGQKVIHKVDVDGDTATLTVDNSWHTMAYQNRLQLAQSYWKAWAAIASPDHPDDARVSFVDHNGNEVGGCGVHGSSVWVQEK